MQKILYTFVSLILVGAFLLLIFPSPIDSVAWQPTTAPRLADISTTKVNNKLIQAQLLAQGEIYGPEDVAVDQQGRVYAGTQDGFIKRIHNDGTVETWVKTGGRPLGMHFDQHANLLVCDAYKGLLSISPDAVITVLTNSADNIPLAFADDVDIATDGKIYFTDASSKWSQAEYMLDLLETRPYGRFLVYDPRDKSTTTLLDNLYFSNGVAISADEDFVLVNETWRYRIIRYWLKGDKAGTHDIFIENLPGFPDGISRGTKGNFWLALPTLRLAAVDKMHPKPWLKNLSAKLPDWLKPRPVDYGLVLELDNHGNIISSLHDPAGENLKEITSAQEHNGYLYLGSLNNDRIGKLKLSN